MPYPGLRVRVLGSVVIIQPLESAGEQALSLTVDLKSGRVELAPQAPIKNDCLVVLAMVGVMSLSSQAAVALVTGAEQVATVSGHPIFRVTQTKVLEAERRTRDPGDDRYMALLKAALDPEAHGRGLYFSLGLNLTLSAEHRATGLADGASAEKHMYAKEDARFFWNRNLCTKLIDANAHGFIYPLVQGFVGQLDSLVFRNKERYASASITLIARRSVQRVGTRHWRRGADKQGNVANFVETEQLVDFDNGKHVASHVQIRGSIPLLWTQIPNIKYKPPTEMAGRSAHASVFDQHMSHLLEVYKVIICFPIWRCI
ncbi:unnamed protein product [Ostreobium quekettii]|uniref:SAC domain-containing protein n=1 Tax=Ostreobium quekettii TaxID=121088 RepID=A0A8S1J9C4_9CHLO|nr:unnamed protein product [Ostreobium quekettii]